MKKKTGKKRKPSSLKVLKDKQISVLLKKANRFLSQNHVDQAVDTFEAILRLDPNNNTALLNYAQACVRDREFFKAAELLEKLRDRGELSPENLGNLAMVYCYLQQWDSALKINKSILHRGSKNVHALYYTGYAYRGKGDAEQSIPYFRSVIELQPNMVEGYIELCAALNQLGKENELLTLLGQMETVQRGMDNNQQATLLFTLGQYHDRFGNYSRAFGYINRANSLRMHGRRYDIENDERFIQQIITRIDHEFVQKNVGCGIDDPSPVFIIGMPRSGTSLVEQIISSHPAVDAGGELKYMYKFSMAFDYSDPCSSARKLAEQYLHASKPYGKGHNYLTDKLPGNYLFTGLIHVAFPNAKIIHCMRDPMDTCFSCYQQNFQGAHYYSSDLESQGRYYQLYLFLMKHWQSILPSRILNICYEKLVNNFEPEVKRIIDHCSLPWDNGCLTFFESRRRIDTASRDQVNKPIYSTSIGRWKNYEAFLDPLKRGLEYTPRMKS